ncbi:hypothetical protein [Paenibacillus sp. TC-CSREp1]|uniref:hypothetical protein n=1 Tax=Paenibacillus sp. TC-CSREp1 TaxID=3410089 RepID=UPI003CE8A55C
MEVQQRALHDIQPLIIRRAQNLEELVTSTPVVIWRIGDPLYDPNRHTFVTELLWTADGRPDFRSSVEALARSLQ